jgi:hypothetical protein
MFKVIFQCKRCEKEYVSKEYSELNDFNKDIVRSPSTKPMFSKIGKDGLCTICSNELESVRKQARDYREKVLRKFWGKRYEEEAKFDEN